MNLKSMHPEPQPQDFSSQTMNLNPCVGWEQGRVARPVRRAHRRARPRRVVRHSRRRTPAARRTAQQRRQWWRQEGGSRGAGGVA